VRSHAEILQSGGAERRELLDLSRETLALTKEVRDGRRGSA
jgi:hypothetical protein